MTKPWHLAVRAQREPGCQQLTRNAECDAERPAPLPAFFVSPDVFLLKLMPRDAWGFFCHHPRTTGKKTAPAGEGRSGLVGGNLRTRAPYWRGACPALIWIKIKGERHRVIA